MNTDRAMLREVKAYAESLGYVYDGQTRRMHHRFVAPGGQTVIVSRDLSSWRKIHNIKRDLRQCQHAAPIFGETSKST